MDKRIHRFDTWAEFMENAKDGRANPQCSTPLSSCDDEYGDTTPWSGAHSFAEALEYLRDGWKDGISRLKEFQRTIPADLFDSVMPVKEYHPEMRHQITGGGLDVAAHLSGASPEVFVGEVIPHDEGQVVKGKKLITVYYNIANSCFTDEKAFFYRGAYVYSLIEHMENCGYSVELWTLNHVVGSSIRQISYVKTKEFGEMFDTNKLAISLCSNFMLRRFMFSIQEQGDNDEIRDIQCRSYGTPASLSNNDAIATVALPEDMDLNPLYIGTANISDPNLMLAKFKKILDGYVNSNVVQE